jgi:4-hydroxybenzoate polyprenyltransferase
MTKNLLLRIGDYVFVLRPLILIPAWSFFLLGAKAGADLSLPFQARWGFPGGFACLSAIMIMAYLLNQIFDQESDRRNEKCQFLSRGIFTVRTIVLMATCFFLVASYLFRTVESSQRVPLVLALILSLIYSLPPLRLVARPFADLLANAVGYGGIAYSIGFGAFAPISVDMVLRAAPYFFLVGATFLYTTILDVEGDRDSGKITTTVVLGVKRSTDLACFLAVAGLIWAVIFSLWKYGDWLAPLIMAVAVLIFVFGVVQYRSSAASTKTGSNVVQAATVLVTVPAAILWPVYLLLVVPLVIVSRYYYRMRFGLDYPGPAQDA